MSTAMDSGRCLKASTRQAPGGRLFFHMTGALAQFERALIQEHTRAGMRAARARRAAIGRRRTLTAAQVKLDTQRWTGGVVYTYGPGMTFRGSVSFIDHDEDFGITSDSFDSTNVLFGTQIDF